MHKFCLDFILSMHEESLGELTRALGELGEGLEIIPVPRCGTERSRNFKVHVFSQDPTLVFDVCSQFGRFRSVKIQESK